MRAIAGRPVSSELIQDTAARIARIRTRGASAEGDAELAARDAAPLAPFAGGEEEGANDEERESQPPRRDGERMGVREPDERTGEGNADHRQEEHRGRTRVAARWVRADHRLMATMIAIVEVRIDATAPVIAR